MGIPSAVSIGDVIESVHWLCFHCYGCKELCVHEEIHQLQNLIEDLQAVESCLSTFSELLGDDRLTDYRDFVKEQRHCKALGEALRECKSCVDAFVRCIKLSEPRHPLQQPARDQARITTQQWINSHETWRFRQMIGEHTRSLDLLLDDLVWNAPACPQADDLDSESKDLDTLPPAHQNEYSADRDRKDEICEFMRSTGPQPCTLDLSWDDHLTRNFPAYPPTDIFESGAKDLDALSSSELDEYPADLGHKHPTMRMEPRAEKLSSQLGCQYMNKATLLSSTTTDTEYPSTYEPRSICIYRRNGSNIRSYLYHGASLVGIISCWALTVFDCSRISVNELKLPRLCKTTHPPYIPVTNIMAMTPAMIVACVFLAISTTILHYLTLHDQHRHWLILAWSLSAVVLGIRDSTPGHEFVSVYVAWSVIFAMINSWFLHAWIRAREERILAQDSGGVTGELSNGKKGLGAGDKVLIDALVPASPASSLDLENENPRPWRSN